MNSKQENQAGSWNHRKEYHMNIDVTVVPYILLFTAVIPALLAIWLEKKQGRPFITRGIITLVTPNFG
jgi:hypothetical protein